MRVVTIFKDPLRTAQWALTTSVIYKPVSDLLENNHRLYTNQSCG
jgi:hypothetical protein